MLSQKNEKQCLILWSFGKVTFHKTSQSFFEEPRSIPGIKRKAQIVAFHSVLRTSFKQVLFQLDRENTLMFCKASLVMRLLLFCVYYYFAFIINLILSISPGSYMKLQVFPKESKYLEFAINVIRQRCKPWNSYSGPRGFSWFFSAWDERAAKRRSLDIIRVAKWQNFLAASRLVISLYRSIAASRFSHLNGEKSRKTSGTMVWNSCELT